MTYNIKERNLAKYEADNCLGSRNVGFLHYLLLLLNIYTLTHFFILRFRTGAVSLRDGE